MKTLQTGQAEVSPQVMAAAEALLEMFPAAAHLLAGVTLVEARTGKPAQLDLVAVTGTAVVVGVDAGRDPAALVGPRAAGWLVVDLQQEAGLSQPLPVYVFWLGEAPPPEQPDDSPALADAGQISGYIVRASSQNRSPAADGGAAMAALLLQVDAGPADETTRRTPALRRALRALRQLPEQLHPVKFVQGAGPVLPADVGKRLQAAMLDRHNHLEDVNYGKIVPNDYTVEISQENRRDHYLPIEARVVEQWRQRLLEALNTANSRQGYKAYRFGGPVQVRVRPAADLGPAEMRLYCRISSDYAAAPPTTGQPCLVQPARPGGDPRQWPLQEGVTTLGRSRRCTITLDAAAIQQRRMISAQHAYIRCQGGRCWLHDGSPAGKPSLNGSFVNDRPVAAGGQELRDGDVIVLAALDPARPRPDAPGTAAFIFQARCR